MSHYLADLKPCPLCGGDGERCLFSLPMGMDIWYGRCVDCGAVTNLSPRKRDAAGSWNKGKVSKPKREIHFHTEWQYNCETSWTDLVKTLMYPDIDVIHTTQMGLLNTELIHMGFRIFIQDKHGEYEIKFGPGNERTIREIRYTHNLFKLWWSGEFDIDEPIEDKRKR